MDNSVPRSIRVHSVRHELLPVVLMRRSLPRCQSPRGLVVSNTKNQRVCKAISNGLFLNNITNRRHSNNRQWTSNPMENTNFSTKRVLQRLPRIIRMGLGSDTGNEPEAARSSGSGIHLTWSLSDNRSKVFTADELGRNIAWIALPSVIALAADPLASLVDTAFVGRIGPVELAAVGVSISVFNLVSKMFNIPLLNVTTSFVAEDASEESSGINVFLKSRESESLSLRGADQNETSEYSTVKVPRMKKFFLPTISSALVLAAALGVGQAFVLSFSAGPILNAMGVGMTSPMRISAMEYLSLRGLGAPAVVIALASQGVFRGLKDTKTPLYASVAGNFVNIFLDPILMFSLNLGVGGAALATVISQYIIAGLLLWNLNKYVVLLPNRWEDLNFDRFLTSGGYLIGRTIALLLVFTLATSMAARQGAIPMAAHQICVQIWLAISLLSDSLALAGQAIIAGAFAKKDFKLVKEASIRVLQIGCVLGVFSALILALGMPTFSRLFTKDDSVLLYVRLLLPFVALTQPINSLAFVFDGLHYGASDFDYAASSMMTLAVPSILVLLYLPQFLGISAVWAGLTTVMSLRMLAGFWRMSSTKGPWRFLNQQMNDNGKEL